MDVPRPVAHGAPGTASSAPVAITATRGIGCTWHLSDADRREQREVARRQPGAATHGDITRADVLALPPDVRADRHRPVDPHPVGTAVGPLERHHRVGAERHRRAGHDPPRRARLESGRVASPAATTPATGSTTRPAAAPRRRPRGRRTRPLRRGRSAAARTGAMTSAALTGPRPSASGTGHRGQRRHQREDPLEVGLDRDQGIQPSEPESTSPAGTRCAVSASSATSPTISTPWPNVQSPSIVSDDAFVSDGAPSGKRLSNSPTSL